VGERRVVRLTEAFLQDLDRQLPSTRTPGGVPSALDFRVHELLRIVELFASSFGDLPELIPGRREYRQLIVVGLLIPRILVVGQLAPDGAVELVEVEIDLEADG
jgi:hypothetical protein